MAITTLRQCALRIHVLTPKDQRWILDQLDDEVRTSLQQLLTQEGCNAVIKQVIARVAQEEIVAIHVSPADFQQINASASDEQDSKLPLVSDERVELGGCLVTLRGGSIDGRIETQFRAFAQSLKDAAKQQ